MLSLINLYGIDMFSDGLPPLWQTHIHTVWSALEKSTKALKRVVVFGQWYKPPSRGPEDRDWDSLHLSHQILIICADPHPSSDGEPARQQREGKRHWMDGWSPHRDTTHSPYKVMVVCGNFQSSDTWAGFTSPLQQNTHTHAKAPCGQCRLSTDDCRHITPTHPNCPSRSSVSSYSYTLAGFSLALQAGSLIKQVSPGNQLGFKLNVVKSISQSAQRHASRSEKWPWDKQRDLPLRLFSYPI